MNINLTQNLYIGIGSHLPATQDASKDIVTFLVIHIILLCSIIVEFYLKNYLNTTFRDHFEFITNIIYTCHYIDIVNITEV